MSGTKVLHCWKGKVQHMEEEYGFGSTEWAEAVCEGDGTCMLPAGHDGPHEWTPDDQIIVSFTGEPT